MQHWGETEHPLSGRARRRGALAIFFLGFLLLTGHAQAAGVFTPAQTLSPGDGAAPQLAVDPQGRTTVVWEGASDVEGTLGVYAIRLDPYGAPLGPARIVGYVPLTNGGQCPCPQVAVDPLGRSTVTWQTVEGSDHRVQAAQVDAAGVPGAIHTLSPVGFDASGQKVEVDSTGRATIVWQINGAAGVIESVRLDANGVPEELQTLSSPTGPTQPQLTVDGGGNAYVVWAAPESIEEVEIDAGGTPGPIHDVVSDPAAGAPQVAVDSEGRATVSWWRGSGAYEAQVVRLTPNGTPGTVQTLSPDEENVFDPRIGIDADGRVTAVWQTFEEQVQAVRLDTSGVPETVRTLSEEGHIAGEPEVAVTPDGRSVVVWAHPSIPFAEPEVEEECLAAEFTADDDVVRAVFLNSSGEPERTVAVSPFEEQSLVAEVALDPLGLPRIAWTSFFGTYFCHDPNPRVRESQEVMLPVPEQAPPEPSPPSAKAVLRVGKKAVIKRGHVVLGATCAGPSGTSCAGELRLVVTPPRGFPSRQAKLALARVRYRLVAGRHLRLSLRLSKAGRRLVAHASRNRIGAHAQGRGVDHSYVVLTLPRTLG